MKIEFFLKRHLKYPLFKMFCLLGRYMAPLTERRIRKENISKIMVFQGGGIGDLIRVFPFIKSLSEEFPNASITILSPFDRDFFDLYPYSHILEEIIVLDVAYRHKSIFNKFKLISLLRKKSFDLIICPQSGVGMIEFSIISFLIGAPYRIGYDKKGAGFLYTTKLELNNNESIYDQNINILRSAGINAYFDDHYIDVPEDDLNHARTFLQINGAVDDSLVFLISPVVMADTGNKSPQHNRSLAEPRTWPAQNYTSLIDRISERYRSKVILLGSKLPPGILSDFLKDSKNPNLISAVGKTTLRQVAALIKCSSILISNDSGLLHIALAFRKPCIGIFGSTSPEQQILSTHEQCTAIWKRLDCSPCYSQEPMPRFDCPNEIICLRSITVNDVMEAIATLIPVSS